MKKQPKFLGMDIDNHCPCGKKINPKRDRQELVLDRMNKLWMRVCKKCIDAGMFFSA